MKNKSKYLVDLIAMPVRYTYMDIRWFRYFVAVVEAGSFSEASRQLKIAQPALSRHVRAIEADLNVILLARTSSGVTMTENGELFYGAALDILRKVDSVYEVVGSPSELIVGRVVIGLPTSASVVLATPLILAARRRLPNIQLHVVESLSGFLLEWLHAGRIDLAILYDIEADPVLHVESLLDEELWLVGARNLLAPFPPNGVKLADLANLPLVLPGMPHSLRKLIGNAELRAGTRLNVIAEADSLHVARKVAASGLAASILSRNAVREQIESGEVSVLPIRSPQIKRSVDLARPLTRAVTRATEEISCLCVDVAKEISRGGVWVRSGETVDSRENT